MAASSEAASSCSAVCCSSLWSRVQLISAVFGSIAGQSAGPTPEPKPRPAPAPVLAPAPTPVPMPIDSCLLVMVASSGLAIEALESVLAATVAPLEESPCRGSPDYPSVVACWASFTRCTVVKEPVAEPASFGERPAGSSTR